MMALGSVALLGLGNMGSALARALRICNYRVAAWNRRDSSKKAKELGLDLAATPLVAIGEANTVIVCLSTYAATKEVLSQPGVAEALTGKTLIQLSSGLPQETVEMAAWAAERHIGYLEGKIAVVPRSIGLPDTVIFYAGEKAIFDEQLHVLRAFGGVPFHVAEEIDAASHADFAFLCYFFLSTIGTLYTAAFCQAAGIDQERFLDLMPRFSHDLIGRIPSFQQSLATADFASAVQSSLNVDLNGAKLLLNAARTLGVASEPAEFIVETFQRAVSAGMGKLDTAALAKLFGRSGS